MARVFVIGSLNNDIVVTADRHPKPGETLQGDSLAHYSGGKGLNQAIAAKRAGADTVMIGVVGSDAAGESLRSYLASEGVGVAGVQSVSDSPTGTAIITVAGGENSIVYVAGANNTLSTNQLHDFAPQAGDVVVAQFETPTTTTLRAFEKARSEGAVTVLNPAPAKQVPPELLVLTDYLIVNEHEFAIIFGQSSQDARQQNNVLSATGKNFSGTLVLTLGEEGVIAWSKEQVFKESGVSIEVVDSTGAGDCFVGYMAAALAQGEDLAEILNTANAAAAQSVTKPGAAASIPRRDELGVR